MDTTTIRYVYDTIRYNHHRKALELKLSPVDTTYRALQIIVALKMQGRIAAVRRWRSAAIHTGTRTSTPYGRRGSACSPIATTTTTKPTIGNTSNEGHVGRRNYSYCAQLADYRRHYRKRRYENISYFHTTSYPPQGSSQPIASAISNDDNDTINDTTTTDDQEQKEQQLALDKEIEAFTDACLTQLLPDDTEIDNSYNNGNEEKISLRRTASSYDNVRVDDENDNDNMDCYDSNHDLGIVEESESSSLHKQESVQDSSGYGNNTTKKTSFNDTTSILEMLRNFDPENPPTSGDPEELQLWLECFSQRETVVRHQDMLKKARDRKAFDSMSLMQRHVVQWFQGLRDAIEIRQKEFLSSEDKRRGSKRYGPFLCSLHPDKMAVILAQEAVIRALLISGKDGKEGIALVKMASAVGKAVETEVVSQRRMKERFHNPIHSTSSSDTDTDTNDQEDDDNDNNDDEASNEYSMDRWSFSASHLKLFFEDLQRMGMGKNKRSVQYAIKKTKEAMNSGETWSNDDIIHLGAALVSIITENAMMNVNGKEEPAFRVEKRWSKKRNWVVSYVIMNSHLHKIFLEEEYLSWAAYTTRHMPMIVPPSDWTGPNRGGYRWLEVEMMRTHRSNVQKEALEHADLSIVCEGLNILGKTAWKINKGIYEVGEYCWDNNIPIGDIPSRTDLKVPTEPKYPVAYDPNMYTNKNDPGMKEKIEAVQSFRDSMLKYKRIIQKNMVRVVCFVPPCLLCLLACTFIFAVLLFF